MYIRFASHRARAYGLRCLDRQPDAYWSLRRKTGPGGVYDVTPEEAERMRECAHGRRFTTLRGPFDDLHRCWKD